MKCFPWFGTIWKLKKKREEHSWRSVTFSTKIHSFMGVFTIFKLYNWYQIGQSITFKRVGWQIYKDYKEHGFRYKTNLAFQVDQISVKKLQFIICTVRWKKDEDLKYSLMYTCRMDLVPCVIIAVFVAVLIFWQVVDSTKIWFNLLMHNFRKWSDTL